MRELFRDVMLALGTVFGFLQVWFYYHQNSNPQTAAVGSLAHPMGGPILVAVLFIIAGVLNLAPLVVRRYSLGKHEEKQWEGTGLPVTLHSDIRERKQSSSFVLEVDGSQPLDGTADWRFFLTNCTTDILQYVQLGPIRSEIGSCEIRFTEIPVMQPGEKVMVGYEIFPRREVDLDARRSPSLWEFALDHTGERGHSYIWYDTSVIYRDKDGSARDGGLLGVCFDLENKKLKTEGAEYYRKNNYNAMFAESTRQFAEVERGSKKLL